jgi:ankyrin repeat protein
MLVSFKKTMLFLAIAVSLAAFAAPGCADVNARDDNGRTALILATADNSDPGVIDTLLKSGADVNARDNEGWTALMWAATVDNSDLGVIDTLLKSGADVNAQGNDGWTALIVAAAGTYARDPAEADMVAAEGSKKPEVISALLKAGADVNARGDGGWTALIFAAAADNTDPAIIGALLKAGAAVNAQNDNGETALIRAALYNPDPGVIYALLKAGVDVRLKDGEGKTALDYAKENEALKNDAGLLRALDPNAAAGSAPSAGASAATVSGENVRVRAEPNTGAAVLKQLSKGTELEVLGSRSTNEKYLWYQVRYQGGTGWVYGQFLSVKSR